MITIRGVGVGLITIVGVGVSLITIRGVGVSLITIVGVGVCFMTIVGVSFITIVGVVVSFISMVGEEGAGDGDRDGVDDSDVTREGDGDDTGGGDGEGAGTRKTYLLAMTPHTAIVTINMVITLETRNHLSFRFCFFRAFSFCSIILLPSVQRSLFASTPTKGVPSARQNANEPSA